MMSYSGRGQPRRKPGWLYWLACVMRAEPRCWSLKLRRIEGLADCDWRLWL